MTAPVTSKWAKGSGGPSGDEAQNLVAEEREHYYVEDFEDGTLTSSTGRTDRRPLYAPQRTYSIVPESGQGADLRAAEVALSPAFDSRNENNHDRGIRVAEETLVRRLTPTECERLQGFPDGWTDHGADGRRYAALGNAVTVNVAEWIGGRLSWA